MNCYPFQLVPEYRAYVWGGSRLRPHIVPTAETWIVHENDRIAAGSLAGLTLAQAAQHDGEALLGRRAIRRTGLRFPLLIKLLDCAQWLSLQVHPNDAQAEWLAGDGQFGKTEAWHILEAEEGAQIIAGFKPGVTSQVMLPAVGTKALLELVNYLPVQRGDTVLMRAGTIHALGPGLLVYEVQQVSDLTYRVYDWDRPQTGGRVLHLAQAQEVLNPQAECQAVSLPASGDGEVRTLTACEYFQLDLIAMETIPVCMDTADESFHALTVIDGRARLVAGEEIVVLDKYETAIVPAACGAYRVIPEMKTRLLKAETVG